MASSPSEKIAVSELEASRNGVDGDLAKRVLRKIDLRIIPLLFVTYMLNFMDKTILSSASVFGLRDDTGLVGQDYSWVSSIFYFGYFAWAYPTTLLIARLPVARYMTVNTFIWGAVVALTAACSNYGGLLAVRFLLGVAEATITPAFMFMTTSWYTRDEIPFRTGIWFSGNSIGGLVASLFAFGVGHISLTDSVGPWRWMYIILGLATFLWGAVLWFALPDSVSSAKFLTLEERQCATARIIVSGTGRTEKTTWNWAQVRECLIDPKTWFIFGLELVTQIPNGGTQNFSNLVIRSFGFTSLQSTLINIPYSLLAGGFIMLTGWLAGRFRRANCLLIVCAVVPCVVGSALIYSRNRPGISHGVQLFGYFLLSTGSAAMPLALSLVQANYRGVTKKMTVTAMLFLAYCAGNIAGPQLFKTTEAPTYNTAFRAIMICYSLAIGLAVGLRTYLGWVNARRAKEEGFEGSAGASGTVGEGKVVDVADTGAGAVNDVELKGRDYEDLTDWQTPGFRYRL
ncbi:MFS general substrate transporter [Trametes versicolor FP-101664 SS1]|uniref:MFS general substrate transporter n=1 Tax=Trametes versicolor (strain FP-101664) TaxID=717944 RepID=UPI0004624786|nr:MFS general substrate transporter [Trametes versicolor FP-101664 SS1]EIW55355.1 MFS general substrate transporter [Trametes versicolor FP-101664 SS1]